MRICRNAPDPTQIWRQLRVTVLVLGFMNLNNLSEHLVIMIKHIHGSTAAQLIIMQCRRVTYTLSEI